MLISLHASLHSTTKTYVLGYLLKLNLQRLMKWFLLMN
jgi:hypothetical protein